MNMNDFDWDRLNGIYPAEFVEKMKGLDGKACWKGYKLAGTKKKGGKTVDDCVKISNHKEGDVATAEMTANYLPEEPGTGPAKNPQMKEAGIRMPRNTVIKKINEKDELAMEAAPNYNEFYSTEPNGRMIVNQLRVMREKVDILLGMLDGTENLEPWCSTKITNAGTALASVSDYLRFGAETV